jgi:hypothetical protein
MINFYATIEIENDDVLQTLRVDLTQNNIIIKNLSEESTSIHHYSFQGDWNAYGFLLERSRKKDTTYSIHSLEHFEES